MSIPITSTLQRRSAAGHLTDYALAFRVSRLDQIEQEALPAGVFDENDSFCSWACPQRAAAQDGFFSSVNGVTVSGRKQ